MPIDTALPFLALWLAGLALWASPTAAPPPGHFRLPAWVLAWVLAAALAWAVGLIDVRATGVVLACVAWSAWWRQASARQAPCGLVAATPWLAGALALALSLHLLPGFHNPVLLDAVQWRPGDPAFSLRASFDKACAALLLLATLVPHPAPAPRRGHGLRWTALMAVVTTGLTLALACALGLTEPASGWPQVPGQPLALPLFLMSNLLITCVAEEAFFRGLIQAGLARRATRFGKPGQALAIAAPATLFGLAHLGGGPLMAALATLVGLGSGVALARTGRLTSAVLVHFSVNATHLLAFTYPARLG